MVERTSYEKLAPSDQLAVDSMVQKAKKEELEEAYRQTKAKDALRKRPISGGEIILIILIAAFIIMIIFMPIIQMSIFEKSFEKAGRDICKSHNSTYQETDFSSWRHVTIVCDNQKIRYP
jgi:hypothetical protein